MKKDLEKYDQLSLSSKVTIYPTNFNYIKLLVNSSTCETFFDFVCEDENLSGNKYKTIEDVHAALNNYCLNYLGITYNTKLIKYQERYYEVDVSKFSWIATDNDGLLCVYGSEPDHMDGIYFNSSYNALIGTLDRLSKDQIKLDWKDSCKKIEDLLV